MLIQHVSFFLLTLLIGLHNSMLIQKTTIIITNRNLL